MGINHRKNGFGKIMRDRNLKPNTISPRALEQTLEQIRFETEIESERIYIFALESFAEGNLDGAIKGFKTVLNMNPRFNPEWHRYHGLIKSESLRFLDLKIKFRDKYPNFDYAASDNYFYATRDELGQ